MTSSLRPQVNLTPSATDEQATSPSQPKPQAIASRSSGIQQMAGRTLSPRSRKSSNNLACENELITVNSWYGTPPGAVAQLGERSVRNAEVEGSIPFRSTRPFFLEEIRETAVECCFDVHSLQCGEYNQNGGQILFKSRSPVGRQTFSGRAVFSCAVGFQQGHLRRALTINSRGDAPRFCQAESASALNGKLGPRARHL